MKAEFDVICSSCNVTMLACTFLSIEQNHLLSNIRLDFNEKYRKNIMSVLYSSGYSNMKRFF